VGRRAGYFATAADAAVFADELTHLLLHQKACFNSPVWFNVGVESKPQCSACFILSVDDTMDSILEWYRREGVIFKGGSGSGVNLSKLRSSKERLVGGGTASGPVSFMKAADASAGVIKSGGKTRRAAKMVVLNIDHPDIMEFINCKTEEERKARALIAAGYDSSLDGAAYGSVAFQNANNSVRVTDAFMNAITSDGDWQTRFVRTGESRRRSAPAISCAAFPRLPTPAAIPACSSTPPSTIGTPAPRAAASTRRIRAASTCTSTTRPVTSRP
jgi:ribonucleoside-diphosphate reductase alpha chain